MITKIFPVEKIREADDFTIAEEPIASIDLMERAAGKCVDWFLEKANHKQEFAIFCGSGNNGGDGLVIARLMQFAGFSVSTYILNFSGKFSKDFEVNYHRLREMRQSQITEWNKMPGIFPDFKEDAIIVDAIFGSGLTRELSGMPSQVISKLNDLSHIKVAIDIPSGLFADKALKNDKTVIFQADYTLSFQFPKLAFLFPENELYVGDWQILDIGLSEKYIQETDSDHYYLNHQFIKTLIKPRLKFGHKGQYGHVLMIAGDQTKMGAALLSSKAALRSGAGLVSCHHPASAQSFLSEVPEIMSSPDQDEECFSTLPKLEKYSHIAIGPGLGLRKQTQKAFKMLIQQTHIPLVVDADALNILSENKTWLSFLPKSSILTPHIGELSRLIGKSRNSYEQLEKAKDFAEKFQIYLLIKGAHSVLCTPTRKAYFNSTGNSGMATGGSGDVLTGIIVGLLAQNYSPLESVLLAVFLHGLSGDIAAKIMGQHSLIASDIIDHLGKAFLEIQRS